MPWKQYLELGVSGTVCVVYSLHNRYLKKQLVRSESKNDSLQELLLKSKEDATMTQKETVKRLLKRLEKMESNVVRPSSKKSKKSQSES